MKFGFIVISPDQNTGLLTSTISSIRGNYDNVPIVCTVPKNASEINKIKNLCSVFEGKETITSLINAGFKNTDAEWNFVTIEGTWVKKRADQKFFQFVKSNKDILYPVLVDYDVQGRPKKIYDDFIHATINGLFMHKNAIKEIGEFSDNPMQISKLMWFITAAEKEYKFKGIIGGRLH